MGQNHSKSMNLHEITWHLRMYNYPSKNMEVWGWVIFSWTKSHGTHHGNYHGKFWGCHHWLVIPFPRFMVKSTTNNPMASHGPLNTSDCPMYGMYNNRFNHKHHGRTDVNSFNWRGIYTCNRNNDVRGCYSIIDHDYLNSKIHRLIYVPVLELYIYIYTYKYNHEYPLCFRIPIRNDEGQS